MVREFDCELSLSGPSAPPNPKGLPELKIPGDAVGFDPARVGSLKTEKVVPPVRRSDPMVVDAPSASPGFPNLALPDGSLIFDPARACFVKTGKVIPPVWKPNPYNTCTTAVSKGGEGEKKDN